MWQRLCSDFRSTVTDLEWMLRIPSSCANVCTAFDFESGEMVPRSLGETVHETKHRELLQFVYLSVGDSGPLGADGLREVDGFIYW